MTEGFDYAAYKAWCERLYGKGCWVPTGEVRAEIERIRRENMREAMQNHDPCDEDRSER